MAHMWISSCACRCKASTTSSWCVPDREDADAAGEVDELIAVDVGDEAAMSRGDADRRQSGVARRYGRFSPRDDCLALGAGNVGGEPDPASWTIGVVVIGGVP